MKDFIEEVIKDLENVEKILPRDALEGLSKDGKERIAFIIGLACIPTREEPNLTLHDVAKRLRKAGQVRLVKSERSRF